MLSSSNNHALLPLPVFVVGATASAAHPIPPVAVHAMILSDSMPFYWPGDLSSPAGRGDRLALPSL